MKQFLSLFILLLITTCAQAQTYKVISRSNDTIRLHPNKVGDALKSVIPGSQPITGHYRLIEKIEDGKESLLFVDFTQTLDKVFVTYETDMIHAGVWKVSTYNFEDLIGATERVNAILLKGELFGMIIEVYQRPDMYKDVINIDGIEMDLPVKVQLIEPNLNSRSLIKMTERERELSRFNLTEEDTAAMADKANECYVAYLLISRHFNNYVDRALLNELCSFDEATNLRTKYNELQLKYLSRGYDTRLNKYYVK